MSFIPSNSLLLKLVASCNLHCDYCYWFRDPEILDRQKKMSIDVLQKSVERIVEYVKEQDFEKINITLHGGEPTLFGIENMDSLCHNLKNKLDECNCKIQLNLTTNETLINEKWAEIFKKHNIGIGISLDGDLKANDRHRLDYQGFSSHEKAVQGIKILQKHGINPGILAVIDPKNDPSEILNYFVNSLSVEWIDFLLPDYTYEDESIPDVSTFCQKLFDIWYDQYSHKGVVIRFFTEIIRSLLFRPVHTEVIGLGHISLITILPDGAIEPHDVSRILPGEKRLTQFNVFDNKLAEMVKHPLWQEMYEASNNIPTKCLGCNYETSCAGGYLFHRFSLKNRFDNPSIHCNSLKNIYSHVWTRISNDIIFESVDQ